MEIPCPCNSRLSGWLMCFCAPCPLWALPNGPPGPWPSPDRRAPQSGRPCVLCPPNTPIQAYSNGLASGIPPPEAAPVSPSPGPQLQGALASFTPGSSSPETSSRVGKSASIQSGSQGPGLLQGLPTSISPRHLSTVPPTRQHPTLTQAKATC